MIIGFDISTAYIGYSILTDGGDFIDIGYLDIKKEPDYYKKADMFESFLRQIKEKYKDKSDIFVEEPLARSNNVNVVNKLQRWNGMACLVIYNTFGEQPELIEHREARKAAGVIIPKGVKGKDLKRYIIEHVQSLYIVPEAVWERKKTNNYKDFCADMADSFVIAMAAASKNN